MSEQILIQVKFSISTLYGEYADAIYYTPSEYANIDLEAHEAEKHRRIDNYLNTIEQANQG